MQIGGLLKNMNLFGKNRIVKKGELRNVEVELVSLLFDDMTPANQKSFVVKSTDGKSYKVKGSSRKFKSETHGTEGRLYVTLMEPEVKDAQGDYYNAEEIQKACDYFSKHGMVGKNDINHNNHPVEDFSVAENYILKTEDKMHFPDSKVGSWVQVLKCDDLDSSLWKKVIKGDFNGVSIYGKADDFGDTAETLKAIHKELEGLKNLKKSLEDEDQKSDFQNSIEELEKKIKSLEEGLGDASLRDAVKSIEKSLSNLNVTMNRAISKSIQGEPTETETDREVIINGEKLLVKATHKEIYKGIADVDSGKAMNILTPNNTSLFIDEVVGSQPGDTLSDISVIPLLKDESIDVGLIEDLIFKNSLDGALTAQEVSTADLSCPTGILNAEFALGRDIVEFYKDKYGEDAFGAYVEQHIAKKAEKAIRVLLFKGDRASLAPKLKALNGIIKKATEANDITEIDKELYDEWTERFEQVLLAFSDEMLEEQENFKIYVSHKDLIHIRTELSKRPTNMGDKLLLEGGNVSFSGIPVKPRLLSDNHIVAGLTKFIIIGYRTDAELKVEHHGADWKYHWYIRIRPGITYVPEFVKIFNIA